MLIAPPALMLQIPAADPMAALRFLQGEWVGVDGDGTPGKAAGACAFTPDLDGKLLLRRSFADYPAAEGRPALHHEDRMAIYAEGGALKADYWDSEGHVIRYAVEASASAVVFTSLPGPGPRFRLSYRLGADGMLVLDFEIAPPGKDFSPYLHARLKRK